MNNFFFIRNNSSSSSSEEEIVLSTSYKDLLDILKTSAYEAGIKRIAIVGGVVRDQLINHYFKGSLQNLKDLDLVVEGSVHLFAEKIIENIGNRRGSIIRKHHSYKTIEMKIDELLIDVATARLEVYSTPGENPNITTTSLEKDLYRRDFTINAIAIDIKSNKLIDLYKGIDAIKNRKIHFIHSQSVKEDPTRIIRAARYAARCNFELTAESLDQIQSTIAEWPWPLNSKKNTLHAPPALGTRLRMELEILFERESWEKALQHMQNWGALSLLDKTLQLDQTWLRRIRWAFKLGIKPLTALIAASPDSLSIAGRLQLQQEQQQLLSESLEIQEYFSNIYLAKKHLKWLPSDWCNEIEEKNWRTEAITLAICLKPPLWKQLLYWLKRWRLVSSPISAKELLNRGMNPGPLLREKLKRLRQKELDRLYGSH